MAQKVPKDKVTAEIKRFIEMDALGCTREEKLREIFGITDPNDPRIHAADCKIYRWRRHPLYDQIWRETIARVDYTDYSDSRKTLRSAMRSFGSDPWLAMQAAVNMLNNAGKRIYGTEESTVNVQITGLPDIGSPDTEDG